MSEALSKLYLTTLKQQRGCHGRDRMVVGFTTTYAIGACHHQSCEFEFQS